MGTERPAVPFITAAAVITGPGAVGVGYLLAYAQRRGGLAGLPEEVYAATMAAAQAIDLASRAYTRRVADVGSRNGSSATPSGAPAARSGHDEGAEVMTGAGDYLPVSAAADLLGVSARRARDLASGGLGTKVGGRWLLTRELVEREAARRAS